MEPLTLQGVLGLSSPRTQARRGLPALLTQDKTTTGILVAGNPARGLGVPECCLFFHCCIQF